MDYKLIFLFVAAYVAFEQTSAFHVATIGSRTVNFLVNFNLFTRGNERRGERLSPGVSNGLLTRRINFPFKIVIHGFLESGRTSTCSTLRGEFLRHLDVNVITVDWSWGSRSPNYFMSAANTRPVGEHVGALVDFLISEGANPSNIHIIGHSLGAHLAGFAGASLRNGRVARITGLDPALPGFHEVSTDLRLDPTDAEFVDVIHTCSGLYGIGTPIGHADFFPNGGRHTQPGCPSLDLGVCSHNRVTDLFAESINPRHRFQALLCNSIPFLGAQGCIWSEHDMGYYLNSTARGIFFSQTRARAPFAMEIRA